MKLLNHRDAMLMSVIESYPDLTASAIGEEYTFRSGQTITTGSLYTTLHRLAHSKRLKTTGCQGNRFYRITVGGRVELKNYRNWTALV
jgi:DNA-binding PadR family transcriptional regulator